MTFWFHVWIHVAILSITALAVSSKTDAKAPQHIPFFSVIFHHISCELCCQSRHKPQAGNVNWKYLAECRRSYHAFLVVHKALCVTWQAYTVTHPWQSQIEQHHITGALTLRASLQGGCVSQRRAWRHSWAAESIAMLTIPDASLLSKTSLAETRVLRRAVQGILAYDSSTETQWPKLADMGI